jgi:hypothetical protein
MSAVVWNPCMPSVPVRREQWRRVTGPAGFPASLSGYVGDGKLGYLCNNFVWCSLRGVHVQLNVLWDFEGPPLIGSRFASFRGAMPRAEARQGAPERFRPEVYVDPNTPALKKAVGGALRRQIDAAQSSYPELELEDRGKEFRLPIPDQLRASHEAHFAHVTRQQHLEYHRNPRALPAWEKPNLAAKHSVTTAGVELARPGFEVD